LRAESESAVITEADLQKEAENFLSAIMLNERRERLEGSFCTAFRRSRATFVS
jgi:hypothetical protein